MDLPDSYSSSRKLHVYAKFVMVMILTVVVSLGISSFSFAQTKQVDTKKLKEAAKEKNEEVINEMKQKLGISDKKDFLVPGKANLNSLDDRFTVFEHDQSWALTNNPNPDLNIFVDGSGQWVGDINGDDKSDFIYRGFPRDISTPELEDRITKTVVYYGGNTSQTPDNIIEGAWLQPVGDIDGDGINDAVNGTNGEIYHGSSSGFSASGKTLASNSFFSDYGFSFGTIVTRGQDLDGDGIGDVLHHSFGRNATIYWGDGSGNEGSSTLPIDAELNSTYNFGNVAYNTGDYDQDGDQELYLIGHDFNTDDYIIRIFDISSDRQTVTVAQEFVFNGSIANLFQQNFYVLDINNSGFNEILISYEFGSAQQVLTEDSSNPGTYDPAIVNIYDEQAVPLGDLNDDGRIDFIVEDTGTDARYISYGPQDLSTGLALDFELTASASLWFWDVNNHYTNQLMGDMDGDGVDDAVMGHNEFKNDEIGRRFLTGNASGDPSSSFTMYPSSQFADNIFETENVGDVNGDGIDDFAMNRSTHSTIEIFFGGSSISQVPDVSLNAELTYQNDEGDTFFSSALGIDGGDFNNDGINDVVVSDNIGIQAKIYSGGTSMDGTADQTLKGTDFKVDGGGSQSTFYLVNTVGDVNDDGIDDFLIGSVLASDSTGNYNNVAYLFHGQDGSLPSSPAVTIPLTDVTDYVGAGWSSDGVGDLNGDGIDDFAVSVPFISNSEGGSGMVNVYFGGSGKDYSSPDLTLKGSSQHFDFGYSIIGGDFNNSDESDIAVASVQHFVDFQEESEPILVFSGGPNMDTEPDHSLRIPAGPVGFGSFLDYVPFFIGHLDKVADYNNDGKDELFADPNLFSGNGLLYSYIRENRDPSAVIEGPNQAVSLSGRWNSAIGDFSDSGTAELVLAQSSDDNDAAFSSREYRYNLPKPIALDSVKDVPNDQGEWVRLTVSGFLMDGLNADVYGFDHWSVWRETDEGDWTNVATVPAYTETSDFVDVHVPRTLPTGEDPDSTNQFNFKVTAHDDNNAPISITEIKTGSALDNIAPPAVQGLTTQRGDSSVTLSWDPSTANDLDLYEIIETDADGNILGEPVATSESTTIELPDSSFKGLRYFGVRGQDLNNNDGETGGPAESIFPVNVTYDVAESWNLIGLPLDISQSEFDDILSKIKDGTLYTFNGSYVEATEVAPGKGYWAKFPASASYDLEALPVTELQLDMRKGWNLVSGIGQALDVTLIEDPNNILIDGTLLGFDGSYVESEQLVPGEAYWIRSSAEGTITLKAASLLSTPSEKSDRNIIAEVKEQFNRVTVEDSEGHSQALYFGNELPKNANPLSFSLPPAAPGEVFDARIAGGEGRLTTDDHFKINLSTITGTSVDLGINLTSTYEHRSITVMEMKDGAVIAEHELRDKDRIDLTDPGSDALKVVPTGLKGMVGTEKPDDYKLFQNYPNPFNPSTVIRYAIPEAADVTLEVYDLLGQKVATLVNSRQKAGFHRVSFDGSDLASGMYLYRLTAGSYQQTNKFILLK